jgi:hypothetical protein
MDGNTTTPQPDDAHIKAKQQVDASVACIIALWEGCASCALDASWRLANLENYMSARFREAKDATARAHVPGTHTECNERCRPRHPDLSVECVIRRFLLLVISRTNPEYKPMDASGCQQNESIFCNVIILTKTDPNGEHRRDKTHPSLPMYTDCIADGWEVPQWLWEDLMPWAIVYLDHKDVHAGLFGEDNRRRLHDSIRNARSAAKQLERLRTLADEVPPVVSHRTRAENRRIRNLDDALTAPGCALTLCTDCINNATR